MKASLFIYAYMHVTEFSLLILNKKKRERKKKIFKIQKKKRSGNSQLAKNPIYKKTK